MNNFCYFVSAILLRYMLCGGIAASKNHAQKRTKLPSDDICGADNIKKLCTYSRDTCLNVHTKDLHGSNIIFSEKDTKQTDLNGCTSFSDDKQCKLVQDIFDLDLEYFDEDLHCISITKSENDRWVVDILNEFSQNTESKEPQHGLNTNIPDPYENSIHITVADVVPGKQEATANMNMPVDTFDPNRSAEEFNYSLANTNAIDDPQSKKTLNACDDIPQIIRIEQCQGDQNGIYTNHQNQSDSSYNVNGKKSYSQDVHVPTVTLINPIDENQSTKTSIKPDALHSNAVTSSEPATTDCEPLRYSYLSFGSTTNTEACYEISGEGIKQVSSQKNEGENIGCTSTSMQDYNDYHAISRNINLKNKEITGLRAGLEKEKLFGDIEVMISKIRHITIMVDPLIDESKDIESVYNFIESLVVKNCSCKYMQDVYFFFITWNCLEFNGALQRWVLRESLWGTHVFFAEFYPYVLWKLEKLNTDDTDALKLSKTREEDYKTNLKEEMKLLCIILEIYNAIIEFEGNDDDYTIHLCLINFHVEKLRNVILQHLETFYASDRATSLYYLANTMNYVNITKMNLRGIENLKITDPTFLSILDQIKIRNKDSKKIRDSRKAFGRTNLGYYEDIHCLNTTKNAIFILAFTVNFISIEPPIHDLKTIKNMKDDDGKLITPGRFLWKFVLNPKKRFDALEGNLYNLLHFLKFMRSKSIRHINDNLLSYNSIDVAQFRMIMNMKNNTRYFTLNVKLILFNFLMIKICGAQL